MQTKWTIPPDLIQTHPRTLNIAILPARSTGPSWKVASMLSVKIFFDSSLLLPYTPGLKQVI